MYERKQNGEVFFLSLAVTCSRFGNCPANGLVTEQLQYSVAVCIFSTLQNTEISLIPNGLRLIFTCLLPLALPCIFHVGRHTAATLLLYHDTPLTTIKEILGHTNIRTTEIYADINEATIYNSISKIKFKELEKVERRIARSFSNKS